MKKLGLLIPLLCLFPLIGCQNKPNGGNNGNNTSVVEDIFYRVNITQSEHGTISADKQQVKQGDLVTFTFTPDGGYDLGKVYINNEEVNPVGDHYTAVNVQQNLTVKAEFIQNSIVVRYFNNEELILLRKVLPNQDASYIGKEPIKPAESGKSYRFAGWTLKGQTELVTSFTFSASTDLYATFEEVVYSFSMKESLIIKTFETGSLDIVTDYPQDILLSGLVVGDETICQLDKDLNVFGYKKGTTTINFVVGGTVIKSCAVSVNNIDNVRTELCYASGAVEYNSDYSVGRYKACQTLIKNLSGTTIDQKYVDFSGDFMFDADISDSDNFGIQFNKELYSSGSIKKGFQFGCTTGYSENVFLKVNGSVSVKISYGITHGTVYNFRVKTTEGSASGKIHIECFINGDKVIDVEKNEIGGTTNYLGFRYANAASSTHYISFTNLYLQ